MSMLRLGLIGRGRLGGAIADLAANDPRFQLVWTVGRDETALAAAQAVDVAIDASQAEAVAAHVDWAARQGTDLVIGTTGWSLPDLAERVGQRCGVMVAPNFSLTVALLSRLSLVLGRYAALSSDGDPYIVEHHHRLKADAPSGTAVRLAHQVLAGCPRKSEWTLGTARPEQLSVGVVRAGWEMGTHQVGIDWPEEVLEVRHTARSRRLFARGALQAAVWLHGRRGVCHFDDLAAAVLDPLFASGGPR